MPGRRPDSVRGPELLIVGLGNPGRKFQHTRHNAGADVVRRFAERIKEKTSPRGISPGGKSLGGKSLGAWEADIRISEPRKTSQYKNLSQPSNINQITGGKVASWAQAWLVETQSQASSSSPWLLACPLTFMNESGKAVATLVKHCKINPESVAEQLIVVHDELDFPPGKFKFKRGGSEGGHNGLISISQRLRTRNYIRLRIGIGKPASKEQGADHVLSRQSPQERQILETAFDDAAGALLLFAQAGFDAAASRLP